MAIAMEQLHCDWDTINSKMWFYDFELLLEEYSKIIEERNEQEKKNKDGDGNTPNMSNYSPDKLMKQAKNAVRIPNFTIPKF